MTGLDRRMFLAASSGVVAAPLLAPAGSMATTMVLRRMDGGLPPDYPTQSRDAVRGLVGASHVDFDAVREMVTARPELAKAAWDWGFGDWESALGAASHMGRVDIAEVLISHGARPNLFTFAMMGQLDVVRAICVANPGIQRQPGPHGITLLRHARNGDAADVVAYLEDLGDADVAVTRLPLTEDEATAFVGEFVPEDAPDVVFRVEYSDRRSILTLARDDYQSRFLRRVGDREFAPSGAPSVRIDFEIRDDRATMMTIVDGGMTLRARRAYSASRSAATGHSADSAPMWWIALQVRGSVYIGSMPNELDVAREAAMTGGAIVAHHFHAGVEIRRKQDVELVSEADTSSEQAIAEVIRRAFPSHAILGEEAHRGDVRSEHLWVVDPLDGTSNFAHGIPHFSVSIAYYRDGEPKCGVVHNPVRDDWFLAVRGGGAEHNERPLRVGAQRELDEVFVGVGFYYDRGAMMEATLAAIHDLFTRQIHGIRRFGTASLDLCMVAAGAFGAFFEYELSPWDFAAGRLIVEEAGGRVTTCRGTSLPLERTTLLASNGPLHEVVLEIVAAHCPSGG